jgi:hypothetical protein
MWVVMIGGLGGAPRPAAAQAPDFAGWHLPLPAGEWLISRGPCGAAGLFTHQCGYYEDRCALDLTPLSGSMASVPVLAPQAGQVFFVGTRNDSGLTVMLEHADGRVSAMMHLAKVVVAPDQRVAQGQVVAYAGSSGSSTRPHLHFHVQPNAVERECLPLDRLDQVDLRALMARSNNLAWTDITLVEPPADLPAWLPLLADGAATRRVLPGRLVLAPGAVVELPVGLPTGQVPAGGVRAGREMLTPALSMAGLTVFTVPLEAPPAAGEYNALLHLVPAANRPAVQHALRLPFTVRPAAETASSRGMVLISPTFVRPANWAVLRAAPELCWSEPASAGPPPLSFRAMVAGPTPADSGWIATTCWQPPALGPGDYAWKVFVRDGQGYMNRPNQRPHVFEIQ